MISKAQPSGLRLFYFIPMSPTGPSARRLPASYLRPVRHIHSLRRERTTKRRGELAELVFTLIATRMGFGISKPHGDSERYDFMLDARKVWDGHSCPSMAATPQLAATSPNDLAACTKCGTSRASRRGSRAPRRPASQDSAPQHATSPTPLCPLDSFPLIWRVQVKCSTQLLNGLYRINAHRRSGRRAIAYLPSEIDFIAAYIIPEDTWYIIPLLAVRGTSLLFRRKKDHRPGLYDQYRQAWHLLRRN